MDDIILNKSENIERCIKRIKDTYTGKENKLTEDFDLQDIVVLNLQRACEAAIDLAMHIIKIKKLGIPKDSREAFTLLGSAKLISRNLAEHLEKMVGFRNIVIHEYTKIDYTIVRKVIQHQLSALSELSKAALKI
jgi:uncharacterized protein YutE (UPF0331/DUF86 family)